MEVLGPNGGQEPGDEDDDEASVRVLWFENDTERAHVLTLPLRSTLGELKQVCARELGVASVEPQDYNGDMDEMSLLALGIGTPDVPFVVNLGDRLPISGLARAASPSPARAAEPRARQRAGLRAAPQGARRGSSARTARSPRAGRSHVSGSEKPSVPRSGSPGTRVPDKGRAAANGPLRNPSDATGNTSAAPLRRAERQALENASDVFEGWIFVGGSLAASSLPALKALGVTHVLNCCDRIPCQFQKAMTYKVVSVYDVQGADITQHFAEALAFIDEAGGADGRILVHCMVGASRSVSIVLAWLVSRQRMPLKDAYVHVKRARNVARPNRAFCEQLMAFEEEVLGTRSATLADFGHT